MQQNMNMNSNNGHVFVHTYIPPAASHPPNPMHKHTHTHTLARYTDTRNALHAKTAFAQICIVIGELLELLWAWSTSYKLAHYEHRHVLMENENQLTAHLGLSVMPPSSRHLAQTNLRWYMHSGNLLTNCIQPLLLSLQPS